MTGVNNIINWVLSKITSENPVRVYGLVAEIVSGGAKGNIERYSSAKTALPATYFTVDNVYFITL